jgi:hypothetical protein
MGGAQRADEIRRILDDLNGLNRNWGIDDLPHSLRQLLRRIAVNRSITCGEVAGLLGVSEEEGALLVSELAARGLIERLPICGDPRYRACIGWDAWTRDRRQGCR